MIFVKDDGAAANEQFQYAPAARLGGNRFIAELVSVVEEDDRACAELLFENAAPPQ